MSQFVYDPEEAADLIDRLKTKLLFEEMPAVDLTPISEQHYLTACALLDQAMAAMKLAHYYRMRRE